MALRKIAWNVLRIGVTVGAIAFVLTQITWKDRLRSDNEWLSGWRVKDNAAFVFRADDGQTLPIPPEPADNLNPAAFVPGFITLFKQVRVGLLIGGLGLFPFTIFLLAKRWQWLLRTHELDPGYREAIRLTWIGQIANNVMPGATGGDIAKALCIYRRSPGKRVASVMTVFIDRVMGLVSLLLLGAIALLFQKGRAELDAASHFVTYGLIAVVVGGIVYFSNRMRRIMRFEKFLARLPFNKQVRHLDDSVFHYRDHLGVLLRCLLISIAIHIWTIGCIFLLGKSLGIRVSIIYYFIFLPVIFTCGAFVPSIAGLGVMETGFQQFFSLPGVGATPSSAVALCILYRLMQLLGSLPGAIPMYAEFSHGGIRKLKESASQPDTAATVAESAA